MFFFAKFPIRKCLKPPFMYPRQFCKNQVKFVFNVSANFFFESHSSGKNFWITFFCRWPQMSDMYLQQKANLCCTDRFLVITNLPLQQQANFFLNKYFLSGVRFLSGVHLPHVTHQISQCIIIYQIIMDIFPACSSNYQRVIFSLGISSRFEPTTFSLVSCNLGMTVLRGILHFFDRNKGSPDWQPCSISQLPSVANTWPIHF